MSISAFIKRKCKQTIVYWGNPHSNGFQNVFDAPVEIKGRWEEKNQLIRDEQSVSVASRTLVYVTQELDEEGWLWLGSLSSLSVAQKANPKLVDGASIIKKFEKSPALNSETDFYYKAWLTPLLT